MKIKDLIEQLQMYDPELLVFGYGFDESGFQEIVQIGLEKISKVSCKYLHAPTHELDKNGFEVLIIDPQFY